MPERIVSTSEAARELGVDPSTLRRAARDGRVEALTTPGGHYRFRLDTTEEDDRG